MFSLTSLHLYDFTPQQVEESGNEFKLPTLSPRPAAAAMRADADRQWLPLPDVTSSVTSSSKRARNGDEMGAATVAVARSLTAFPGSVNARSRDFRKY